MTQNPALRQPVAVKLLNALARLPHYETSGAAGADLCAAFPGDPISIPPGGRALVKTGLSIELVPGFEAQIRPRSGLALKQGITVLNTPGTVDRDYRGEVGVILINLGQEPFVVRSGDRIAQMVIAPVVQAEFAIVEDLTETERGAGGFGSTGITRD